jgi:cell division protein FtsL
MSKFIHLAHAAKRIPRAKKNIKFKNINWRTINIFLGFLVVLTFISYLIQINGLATKGYQIKELEQKIFELQQETADLELEALGLQSLNAVQDRVNQLEMVAVGQTEYLAPAPVAIAR